MQLRSAFLFSLLFVFSNPVHASRTSLLGALSDNFSVIRAAPYMSPIPTHLGEDQVRWLKTNRLMRGESIVTGFQKDKFMRSTPNLLMLSLSGSVFSLANKVLISALGSTLRPMGDVYMTDTLKLAHEMSVKPGTERHLIHLKAVVNSLRIIPHNKIVILIEELDTEDFLQFAALLNTLQMPGFIYFTEIDRARAIKFNLIQDSEKVNLKPFLGIYQNGKCMMQESYELSTASCPGQDCFFPEIARHLIQHEKAVKSLPVIQHEYSTKLVSNSNEKRSELRTHILTNFEIGLTRGFIRPDSSGRKLWEIMRRTGEGTYQVYSYYPRAVETKS